MGLFRIAVGAPHASMTVARRKDRAVDELIGIARGILADGALNSAEAQFLHDWLRRNAEHADQYPFNILMARIGEALSDGVLSRDEEAEIMHAMISLAGGNAPIGAPSPSMAGDLPLDDPAPSINWASLFCVTGTFAYGARAAVVEAIRAKGGEWADTVSKKVGVLVIGDVGSRDWAHSSFGRKIQKAVELREAGLPIAIVSEGHWTAHL